MTTQATDKDKIIADLVEALQHALTIIQELQDMKSFGAPLGIIEAEIQAALRKVQP